jgi:DNA-binding transcriptional ArsR family regulator
MVAGATDAAAVRALAHPLRLQLLDLLRFNGPSTATLLGRRVGESSGSTSYHLRQLARYGFIEEAPARGGRERWWRYRSRRVTLDAGGRGGRELLPELLSREAHALDRFLARREALPEWDAASFFTSLALRLTAAELAELRDGLEELLARFRRAEAADPPGEAKPVRLLSFAYPLPLEET